MAGAYVWSLGLGGKWCMILVFLPVMQKGLRSPDTGYYREFIYIVLLNANCPHCGLDLHFYDHWVSGMFLHIFIGGLRFLWIGSSCLWRSCLCSCWLIQMLCAWTLASSCLTIHIVILHSKLCVMWPLGFILYVFMVFKVSLGKKMILMQSNLPHLGLLSLYLGTLSGKGFTYMNTQQTCTITSLCFNVINWSFFQCFSTYIFYNKCLALLYSTVVSPTELD